LVGATVKLKRRNSDADNGSIRLSANSTAATSPTNGSSDWIFNSPHFHSGAPRHFDAAMVLDIGTKA
jgi:hypothetical protein